MVLKIVCSTWSTRTSFSVPVNWCVHGQFRQKTLSSTSQESYKSRDLRSLISFRLTHEAKTYEKGLNMLIFGEPGKIA